MEDPVYVANIIGLHNHIFGGANNTFISRCSCLLDVLLGIQLGYDILNSCSFVKENVNMKHMYCEAHVKLTIQTRKTLYVCMLICNF